MLENFQVGGSKTKQSYLTITEKTAQDKRSSIECSEDAIIKNYSADF